MIGRRHSGRPALLALALGCAGLAAFAQGDASERERIARERAAAQARFVLKDRECQARFAVTACVDEAKRERRSTLTELRSRSATLDEADRKQRAERRRQAIQENLARDEAEQRALLREQARGPREPRIVPIARPRPAAREGGKAARAVTPRASEPRQPAASSAAADAARRAQEDLNRARFNARRSAAQEHREEVEQRNAQRAAQNKAAVPLPVPGASAP
jgi:hypothetical protein